MSLEVATWIVAIATVILAAGAGITAKFAWDALQRQSAEVKAIEQQVSDQKDLASSQGEMLQLQAQEFRRAAAERDHDAQERRRAQASQVYVWEALVHVEANGQVTPGMTVEVYVRNTSLQPIYDLRIQWHAFTSDRRVPTDDTYREPIIMPGAETRSRAMTLSGFLAEPSDATALVTFRDRGGVWWRARPDGRLEELSGPPAEGPAGPK